ncbi:unnamed protein product [Leuciscus chuanchicus]
MAPKKLVQFKQRDEAVSVEELEDVPAAVGGVPQVADDPGQLTMQNLAERFRKNMEHRKDSGSLPSTLKVHVAAVAAIRSTVDGQWIDREATHLNVVEIEIVTLRSHPQGDIHRHLYHLHIVEMSCTPPSIETVTVIEPIDIVTSVCLHIIENITSACLHIIENATSARLHIIVIVTTAHLHIIEIVTSAHRLIIEIVTPACLHIMVLNMPALLLIVIANMSARLYIIVIISALHLIVAYITPLIIRIVM